MKGPSRQSQPLLFTVDRQGQCRFATEWGWVLPNWIEFGLGFNLSFNLGFQKSRPNEVLVGEGLARGMVDSGPSSDNYSPQLS